MLRDRRWKLKYTREDGDLVAQFYVPALESAARYDRLTGYFDAGALALAARGVEGLARNNGRMRLIVGCTLDPAHIAAVERGAALREQAERRLAAVPLEPPDADAEAALELLAWMVARGLLDVKAAVPCDAARRPVADPAIFHEKTGIVLDGAGNSLAWTGSLNETAAGWTRNWESIAVYTSWGPEPGRVAGEEASFASLWANRAGRALVLDLPEAARRGLLNFLPAGDAPPRRLQGAAPSAPAPSPPPAPAPDSPPPDKRALVWGFIAAAPNLEPGGARVGEATGAVEPWPHQVRAFERLYANWPPRLLIADEVGLGKTIQAGMLLRQAWLAGKARRVLILAPKAVLGQWQRELREKFNLDWPVYDRGKLAFCRSPARGGDIERDVERPHWRGERAVIVSSQTMRRQDRAAELLEAEPWDLVVLDEAHHARRPGAGTANEGGPNALLSLMRRMVERERARGLLLLTATPMQLHPVELWDLLDLLGLPPEWTEDAFVRFFADLGKPSPGPEELDRMAALFRAAERAFGPLSEADARRIANLSPFAAGKTLGALRNASAIPRRRLETPERKAALALMRARTPVRALVSRHTRDLLRKYAAQGALDAPIAERRVEDRFVAMTHGERALYKDVETYISNVWKRAAARERAAVGFAMTIYRRRLASSLRALRATLERHLDALAPGGGRPLESLDEDLSDDETRGDVLDADESAERERAALAFEERAAVAGLIDSIRALPADSKRAALAAALAELRRGGYERVMVFTQYTDTMDFLRDEPLAGGAWRPMCFSGRGGEIPRPEGGWREVERDEVAPRFRDGDADLLLCTDAAAEGLNFQFCGALVNYDMPWNPMRVEQRIGRIDRLGQRHPQIRIVNLHYEKSVETAVYAALRKRINLFQSVVGRLQPILSRLPAIIADAVFSGADAEGELDRRIREAEREGFAIDDVLDADLAMPPRPPAPLDLADLDRVLTAPGLMPPGVEVSRLDKRDYTLLAPGMSAPVRVTTDAALYRDHPDNFELWSPGNPLFRPPGAVAPPSRLPPAAALRDILNR